MGHDFNTVLGLHPGDEAGTLILDPRPEHQVAPDVVHFAVLTTLAEISAARAVRVSVAPATVTVHLLSRAAGAPRRQGPGVSRGTTVGGRGGRGHPGRRAGGQGDRTVRTPRLSGATAPSPSSRGAHSSRDSRMPRALHHPGLDSDHEADARQVGVARGHRGRDSVERPQRAWYPGAGRYAGESVRSAACSLPVRS